MWKYVKKISSPSSSSPLVESNVRLVRSDFLGHLDPIFPLSCLSNNSASTLENDFQEMQTISSPDYVLRRLVGMDKNQFQY